MRLQVAFTLLVPCLLFTKVGSTLAQQPSLHLLAIPLVNTLQVTSITFLSLHQAFSFFCSLYTATPGQHPPGSFYHCLSGFFLLPFALHSYPWSNSLQVPARSRPFFNCHYFSFLHFVVLGDKATYSAACSMHCQCIASPTELSAVVCD